MTNKTLFSLKLECFNHFYFRDVIFKSFLRIFSIIVVCAAMVACSQKTPMTTLNFSPDTTTVLRNPLNGWVMYLGRNWDENFWDTQGYDTMRVSETQTVKVSDYASTCYIRTSWSSLEPKEGDYVWNDSTARITKLLNSVLDRNMRLAFRIVVDGRDQGQNTPLYVFDAGASYYTDSNNVKSPYPDDPVFQSKYQSFIEALAVKFNNPDIVDFIDGYGLGKWGEAHSMVYKDYSNKAKVFEWVTGLYARCFTKIPLIINYHRLVGANNVTGWGEVAPDTEELLNSAIEKGYSLRHDAFGMNGYYQDWEKDFVSKWNFKRPVIMEGGWITGGTHRYWRDPSGNYREGHSEDVRKGEYLASAEAHVNMMDFRIGDETASWFHECFDLVKRFVKEGGYRLYPDFVSFPQEVISNSKVKFKYRWNNIGWGYCPTNIPQWNQRYKVAVAILDNDDEVNYVFVNNETDLSKWIKGSPVTYEQDISVEGIPSGEYVWAIGLVDTTKDNSIGIQIALKDNKTEAGWIKLGKVTIL